MTDNTMRDENRMSIDSLKVTLHTDKAVAAALQHAVSLAVRGELSRGLAALAARFALSHRHLVIERLTLDIGTLPLAGFDSAFVQAVLAKVAATLECVARPGNAAIQGAGWAAYSATVVPHTSVVYPDTSPSVGGHLPLPLDTGKSTAERGSTTTEREHSPLQRLLRYLGNGVWPPDGGQSEHHSPSAVMQALLTQRDTAPFLRALIDCLCLPVARHRFLQSISGAVRRQLADQLTTVNLVQVAAKVPGETPAALSLAIWHYLLAHAAFRPVAIPDHHVRFPAAIAGLTAAELSWIDGLLCASAAHPEVIISVAGQGELLRAVLQSPQLAALSPSAHLALSAASDAITQAAGREVRSAQARRLPEDSTLPEEVRVFNAGVVFIWPLLPRLLSELGLLGKDDEKAPLAFISQQAQQQAICWLDYLLWGDDEGGEHRVMVNKLLCNWPLQAPLDEWFLPDEIQRQQLDVRIGQIAMQVPGWQKCQPSDVRSLFLQRPGTLTQTRDGWRLTVDPHPADMMLMHLPWPVKQIIWPWLPLPLDVTWEKPGLPGF